MEAPKRCKSEFFKTWLVRILINECHNIGEAIEARNAG